jgi:poly(3-hydroxybutyrate) depolymerase
MRRGGRRQPFAGRQPGTMPTLVIHGQADDTVHPDNGEQLTAGALAVLQAAGLALTCVQSEEGTASARPAQVRRWIDAQGMVQLEHWTLPAGVHAWSGGDPSGSFTDPQGPDASQAMLTFFLRHRRPGSA